MPELQSSLAVSGMFVSRENWGRGSIWGSGARVKIRVNGEEREVPEQCSVADLLAEMQRNPRYLAVERNKQLIPRGQHASCLLESGDELEIVTLVGGG